MPEQVELSEENSSEPMDLQEQPKDTDFNLDLDMNLSEISPEIKSDVIAEDTIADKIEAPLDLNLDL
jgi:hypothetical protein